MDCSSVLHSAAKLTTHRISYSLKEKTYYSLRSSRSLKPFFIDI